MNDDENKLPAKADVADETEDSTISTAMDAFLRAQAVVEAINANLPASKHLPPIPKEYVFRAYDKRAVVASINAAFELNGGVPRFVQWAAENPGKFYDMWSKLANLDVSTNINGTTININTPIPATPQDDLEIDANGRAFNAAVDAEYTDVSDDED